MNHVPNCGCLNSDEECFFVFIKRVAALCSHTVGFLILSFSPGTSNDPEIIGEPISEMIGLLASAQGEQTDEWCAKALEEIYNEHLPN